MEKLTNSSSNRHKLMRGSSKLGFETDNGKCGFSWPQRNFTCSFCKKEFKSAQALGGHMNVHRRDRAKMRLSPSPWDAILNANPNPNFSSSSSPSYSPSPSASAAKFLPDNMAHRSSSSATAGKEKVALVSHLPAVVERRDVKGSGGGLNLNNGALVELRDLLPALAKRNAYSRVWKKKADRLGSDSDKGNSFGEARHDDLDLELRLGGSQSV